jgi:hypothetical protein
MDENSFDRLGGFSIPPRMGKTIKYCIKSFIYGEKTDTTLATAATLASFVAYPLHIITGKTALKIQTTLLLKHVLVGHFFLNNLDSNFAAKGAHVNELCKQYSIFLLGSGICYATLITLAGIAARFSCKK